MGASLTNFIAKIVKDLQSDWKLYQELRDVRCAACNDHVTKLSFLEFVIRKRIKPKSNLIVDFNPTTTERNFFHLECAIATQIKYPSLQAEMDRADKSFCEREVIIEKNIFDKLLRMAYEKAPYEVFGVLKRDGERVTEIVKTYSSRMYATPLNEKQRKKVVKALRSGYDSTFHSHLFTPIIGGGDEADFLAMGCQLMLIMGGTYKKLVYTSPRVRKILGLSEKPLDSASAYKQFKSEYKLSDASAYVLEDGEIRRAKIKVEE